MVAEYKKRTEKGYCFMIQTIIQRIKQKINEVLQFQYTDFVDFTRITSKDINKFFYIFSNTNILSSGVNVYQGRSKVIFVFIVENNKTIEKSENIIKFFLNPNNLGFFFEGNKGVNIEINEVSTDNLQFYNLGVGVIYVEVILYNQIEV